MCRLANVHVVAARENMAEVRKFRENVAKYLRVHAIAQRHSVRCEESLTLDEVRAYLTDHQIDEFKRVGKNLSQLPLRWLGEEWLSVRDYMTHSRILDQAVR